MTNKKTNNTTNKFNTQKEAVLAYLRRNPKSKMTAERICEGIQKTYGMKLTPMQVSQCLTRFSVNNLVKKHDNLGVTTSGRKNVYRWMYSTSNIS